MKYIYPVKKITTFFLLLSFIAAVSCKKTPGDGSAGGGTGPIDDNVQVSASISGIVSDENNIPIAGATVTSGTASTTTSAYGQFVFNNISVSKANGNVTVTKAGYFKGIRSFITTAGKNHSVKIILMQRVLSGTVNAATGGVINSTGTATITFPANAFVTTGGTAYTGTVNVYSRWIDPSSANLPFIMPGDLRGISTSGAEKMLETYGMVGAELEDASGNSLQIATGKTATVSFPIPAALSTAAPASITLWHFDDVKARWAEAGTATRSGNTYSAAVDRFSFWNVDAGNDLIYLDYSLINAANGSALVFTSTRIKRVLNNSYGYGLTNNAGYVMGGVPKNEALVLEVVSGCGTVVYSQNIGPFSSSTSLGNISVTLPAAQYISFTGSISSCSGGAVSNGYISFYATNGQNAFAATNSSGAFSYSILNCPGTTLTYGYFGVDIATNQQTDLLTGTATNGTVTIGNIITCSTPAHHVYVVGQQAGIAKLWIDGVATSLTSGTVGSVANSVYVSGSDVYIAGGVRPTPGGLLQATLWKNGVATTLSSPGASAVANSVFVLGSDVYVAGSESDYPFVWKNGVGTNLTTVAGGYTSGGSANSVFVANNIVYVAGQQFGGAFLWQNNNFTSLATSGTATSIFVSGTTVYMSGYDNPRVTYWIGINSAYLTSNGGAGNGVFASGTDFYVAGSLFNSAVIWKNGNTNPTYYNNGIYNSAGNAVFVLGNDVYLAGRQIIFYSLYDIATVWKNGFPINLTDGSDYAEAKAVFVK